MYAFQSEIDSWWHSRRAVAGVDGRGDEQTAQPAGDGQSSVGSTAEGREFDRNAAAPRRGARRAVVVFLAGLTLVVVSSLLVGSLRAPTTTSGSASIAVLPFKNTVGNLDAEILIDGLTEGIINSLSAEPDLKVISRTSAFKYKGKDIVPRRVGRELGVRVLLLGRVVQRDDRLSLVVDLVDSRDDRQLWGSTYERRVADLGALQEDVVRDVVRTLIGREPSAHRTRHTRNAEVDGLYLLGRYHWNKRTPEGFRHAVSAFSQAIEKDPAYAPAYAGLADSYTLMGYYAYLIPFSEARSKAGAAARTALALDESLAEAHTSMASVMEFEQWDWSGAEREYRRAIQLAPNYASAYHW